LSFRSRYSASSALGCLFFLRIPVCHAWNTSKACSAEIGVIVKLLLLLLGAVQAGVALIVWAICFVVVVVGGMGLEATFCLSPGDDPTGLFESGTRNMKWPLRHRCTMTLHYIRAPSRCPDIDPEYMPFERFGNIIVGPPSVGTWAELEPQVLAVARSSELRQRVSTEPRCPPHFPGGLAPIMTC
jgi:hypothetical protein